MFDSWLSINHIKYSFDRLIISYIMIYILIMYIYLVFSFEKMNWNDILNNILNNILKCVTIFTNT